MHLSDHYASTVQPTADSPFHGSVLCDFASAADQRTAKVGRGQVSTIGTAQDLLQKIRTGFGVSAAQCPSVDAGDTGFACSDATQAVVVAQRGGTIVFAYRGGQPGGAAMTAQATAIAKAVLGGA